MQVRMVKVGRKTWHAVTLVTKEQEMNKAGQLLQFSDERAVTETLVQTAMHSAAANKRTGVQRGSFPLKGYQAVKTLNTTPCCCCCRQKGITRRAYKPASTPQGSMEVMTHLEPPLSRLLRDDACAVGCM